MRRVYMDANATTPLLPEVLEVMGPFFLREFGNASSIHHYGQHARAAVERAREQVATLLGCRPAEIVFTSGGTEADNLAIFGLVKAGDHIITTQVEHHAVLNTCTHLEERGCEVTCLRVDSQGLIRPDDLRQNIRKNTKLISVMMANNETGVLQPLEEIGKIAAESGVSFHTDAVQAAGKIPIAVKQIGCDLLSISGHKMHGPQGTGALYVKRGTLLEPMLYGGNHERARRAGTENLPGIVGLGKAAEIAARGLAQGSAEKLSAMRNKLEQSLITKIDSAGVNSGRAPRVPNTTNLYFDFIEGEAMIIALDLKGLAVSTGAACSSGAIEPSHVLTAMGLSPDRARASIRFSLGKHNSDADVDYALEVVPETIARLRELSPLYQPAAVSTSH